MVQWLYLVGVMVVLLMTWRFVARPWLERRAGPVDERHPLNRAASRDARERRLHDKHHPDIPY